MRFKVYLGIHVGSGRRPFVYAAFDSELHLQALGQGDYPEIVAYAGGQLNALVAVSSPAHLNSFELRKEEVKSQLELTPPGGRFPAVRVCEYLLAQKGYEMARTPARLDDCAEWMRNGFNLYGGLAQLGYTPHPTWETERQWIEVDSGAIFWATLGEKVLPTATLEGRLQRQLALYELGLPVSDPMDFFEEITRHRLRRGLLPMEKIHSPEELNALAAAGMAWRVDSKPEETQKLGIPADGEIFLPVPVQTTQEQNHPVFPNLRR